MAGDGYAGSLSNIFVTSCAFIIISKQKIKMSEKELNDMIETYLIKCSK